MISIGWLLFLLPLSLVAPIDDDWKERNMPANYEHKLREVIATLNHGRYERGLGFELSDWRRDRKFLLRNASHEQETRSESAWLCLREKTILKALKFLHVNILDNCTIPTQASLDSRWIVEDAVRRVEAHPAWAKDYHRTDFRQWDEYVNHILCLTQWASGLSTDAAKELAVSIEKITGKPMRHSLDQWQDLIAKVPEDFRKLPPDDLADTWDVHVYPTVCILDGYEATNEWANDWVDRFLGQLEKDARDAAAYASYCAERNIKSVVRQNGTAYEPFDAAVRNGGYSSHADEIVRRARAWLDAKLSLFWPKAIDREVRKMFPSGDSDETNLTQLAANLSTRLFNMGPINQNYSVLVFPSSYRSPKWASMFSSLDPTDRMNTSIILPDIKGTNVFIGRFRSDSTRPKTLKWLNETGIRGKVEKILQDHHDEEANVLLSRITRETPDLFDGKSPFSSALLLKNRQPFFLSDGIPHSVNGHAINGFIPYESIHTEIKGFWTSTQVYLYLFR